MLKAAWQTLTELLYPYRCLICKKIIEGQEGICVNCTKVFEVRFMDTRILERNYLDVLIFCTHYQDIKHILHAAKFEQKSLGLEILAGVFSDTWQFEHSEYLETVYGINLQNCLAVSVPTDYQRRLARGYDIPQRLFSCWLDKNKVHYNRILRRIRLTKPQFELSRTQRIENVQDSIQVTQNLEGKHIVLLDDIFTTGASMNEAARMLKLHGAKSVVAIAFASDVD